MCLASYFLHFGAEPQSTVGGIQELRTDYSKMKEFGHDNFKLCEAGGDFYERVENTVEKREIAPYDQISFSLSIFKYLYCKNVKTMACLGKFFRFVGVIVRNQSYRW